MTPLFGSDPAPWTDALMVGLLAFAIRATVLLVAAWMAARMLRRASAATRHLIWSSAIAGVLALPLLGAIVPVWHVPVVSIAATLDAPFESSAPMPAVEKRDGSAAVTTLAATSPAPHVPAPAALSGDHSAEQRAAAGAADALTSRLSLQSTLAVLWLVLAAALLSRLAIANARVSAWRRSSRPVEDARWQTLLRSLSRQYGIERPVVLLENPATDVPVTWGVIYPVVLLPESAVQWDEEQRIAVLTHELAHVKRFDALTQLLAQLALALLWFHPLVWMAVRRMRLEREHACDDFVLVAGARASRYADDLLGFARRLTRPTAPAAAALAMARRSELEGRLLAILDPGAKRTEVRRKRVGLLTLAVVAVATPLAAFRPAARVQTEVRQSRQTASAEPALKTIAPSDSYVAPTAAASRPTTEVSTPSMSSALPTISRVRPDTEPPRVVDLETLIDVTKAAKRMTSDHEKGLLLALIAKRYIRSDTLRHSYLEAVFTMTSDHERSQALIALLDRDSLPLNAIAQVLRSTAMMTSDMNKGMVLKRISPSVFADSGVQRAYLDAIVAMTSDMERGAAIASLAKQRPLTPAVQLALLQATVAISSNVEKANVLLLFLDRQGIADEKVRRAFFRTAETLTSDTDYRRIMAAVMK